MCRALLSGFVSISCLFGQAAFAKSELDAATHKQLTMLEGKFFGHTYEAESDDERTQRIEKLIYGTATEGAAPQRIKKLASVTYIDTRPDPVDTPAPRSASTPSPAPPSTSPSRTSQPKVASKTFTEVAAPMKRAAAPPQIADEVDADDEQRDKPGEDSYPHVTALEKEILGSTFVGQPLSGRIVRMENKAFGSPSKSSDLGERTDNLEQYAEQKLHKKPFLDGEMPDTVYDTTVANNSSGANDSSATDQGPEHPRPQSAYPHVTALENEILGQAAPDQPLEKRLSAMEVKAFGKTSTSDDLGGRTDALERYAEKTLHKKPFGQDVDYETADGSPNKAPKGKAEKLLSMVENSLLGMAGGGGGVGGSSVPGFATPGMGPNAFGPMGGFGGPGGFGGIRVRRRQAAPPSEPSAADEPSGPVEDPAVRAKDPPPASARLATRVGWCEMHVFGHTSANLHLAERLSQLNRELNFEPGTSPMVLMDHIDGLVKAAVAFRAPAANSSPISTAARGATH